MTYPPSFSDVTERRPERAIEVFSTMLTSFMRSIDRPIHGRNHQSNVQFC